jgi:hypothetical protein
VPSTPERKEDASAAEVPAVGEAGGEKAEAKNESVAAVPPAADDEFAGVRGILAGGTEFDQREVMARLEKIGREKPELGAEVAAVGELVKRRAEQGKLKKLP